MSKRFSQLQLKDRCSVVIVEAASAVRQAMVDVLKQSGYETVRHVSSPKEALHILESERVDWIITGVFPAEKVNAIHLLKIITLQPTLRRTFVTLLWEDANDQAVLPYAFELGLTSLVTKSYAHNSLLESFKELFATFALNDWDSTLVAAEYIRRYLKVKNQHQAHKIFEEDMLKLYPGSSQILFHLAEAELVLGHSERGGLLLTQAELIDENIAHHAKNLRNIYKLEEQDQDSLPPNVKRNNILGLHTVIVIDPDTDVLFQMKHLLDRAGVDHVETFESGSAAVEWLSTCTREPDLIVMEWRIPGISGATLIQRIRSMGFHLVAIVVISSLIKNSDINILSEMSIDCCREKPIDSKSLYQLIIGEIQSGRKPTEEISLYKKIKQLLKAGKVSEGRSFIPQFFGHKDTPPALKMEIEAMYHLARGNYEKAHRSGVAAIKLGGDALSMLQLVGKALLKCSDFDNALKCLEKAHSLCSVNVERLIDIADASLQLDKVDRATEAMKAARDLDPTNEAVQQLECKVHIINGEADRAKDAMKDIEFGKNTISYMNNRAVALSRTKRFEEAISLYQTTLDAIPKQWKELRASVVYNKALACARQQALGQAKDVLGELVEMSPSSSLYKRVKSLEEKVKHALANNKELVLSTGEDKQDGFVMIMVDETAAAEETSSPSEDFSTLFVESQDLKRGEIGCYLIFMLEEKEPCDLLEHLPPFRPRVAM